jgi:hypothetical protein
MDEDRLIERAPDLWTVSVSHRFMGLPLGARMTVVRLPSGGLWLHSPVALTESVRRELSALGPVHHIVCPNLYHHVYAGEAASVYPDARMHAPRGLRRKRRDLRIDADLTGGPDPDWQGVMEQQPIAGSLLGETVFFHVPSRTLISADLVENFGSSSSPWMRWYLRIGGIENQVGWSRLLRFVYYNRAAARASLERVLAWPIERVVIAHGEPLETDARSRLRHGLSFLRV